MTSLRFEWRSLEETLCVDYAENDRETELVVGDGMQRRDYV